MSWLSPAPLENSWWKRAMEVPPRELFSFLREIFNRHRTFGAFTWNPPNVPANTTVDTTLTTSTVPQLEGLRSGQAVYVTPPSAIDAGVVLGGAWAPADDQLTIRLGNITGVGINPASGTWAFQGVVT